MRCGWAYRGSVWGIISHGGHERPVGADLGADLVCQHHLLIFCTIFFLSVLGAPAEGVRWGLAAVLSGWPS